MGLACLGGAICCGGAGFVRLFECEQEAFHVETTAIPAEASVAAKHAVTRDDDRHWVGGTGRSDGSRSLGIPDVLCDLLVRRRRPVGDVWKVAQDGEPKAGRECVVDRDRKSSERPGEVLLELARHVVEVAVVSAYPGAQPRRQFVHDGVERFMFEADPDKPFIADLH